MAIGLGIDFGGTKVLAGVVDLDNGEVLATAKKRTNPADDTDQMMSRLFTVADEALEKANVASSKLTGIGVGLAGQIDTRRGVLLGAPNLSQSTVNVPMVDILTNRYGVPASLRNDVQVAALGEAAFGAGKGHPDFVCGSVGTGIGGAWVRDGRLGAGAGGAAGEIGHMVVDANGRLCGCGGRGHLEAYASRSAITRAILGELRIGRKSVLSDLMEPDGSGEAGTAAIRSGILAKAFEANDELTVDSIHEAAVYLGLGLASVINLLNPARIIVGGGVIEAIDGIVSIAERTARREALETSSKSVKIVRAALGDFSGVVGAALLTRPGVDD